MPDIHEQIGKWQEATGLSDGGGDPSGVTPDHLSTLIREDENEIRYLKQINKIFYNVLHDSGLIPEALHLTGKIPEPVRTIPEF